MSADSSAKTGSENPPPVTTPSNKTTPAENRDMSFFFVSMFPPWYQTEFDPSRRQPDSTAHENTLFKILFNCCFLIESDPALN
jgi:hypothetical protein